MNNRKFLGSLSSALFFFVGCVGASVTLAEELRADRVQLPDGYRLVWSEEFNRDGLPDAAKWTYDVGMNKEGWHNHEKQYYSAARLENTHIVGGHLGITARLESLKQLSDWGGQKYASARLNTAGKGEWLYGFFEVRAKLPCGRGTWPAIWMLGSTGDWPDRGELDILEHIGNDPNRVISTVHTREKHGNGLGGETQVNDVCATFHVYQMHWTPEFIRFGIDGKAHFTYRNAYRGVAQWPFDSPQFMILNLAVGGDLGGTVDDNAFPVTMLVDYVRVYQPPR